MKKWLTIMMVAVFAALTASAQTVLEEWKFNTEGDGASFASLVNTAGTATWFTAGASLDTPWNVVSNNVMKTFGYTGGSNTYNMAYLSATNLTTGVYDLTYKITDADFAPGITPYEPSFQMILRTDDGADGDDNVFQLRLTTDSNNSGIGTNYIFQARNPDFTVFPFSDLTALEGYNSLNPISNLTVRVRVDIENNEWSAYYKLSTTAEKPIFEFMETQPSTWGHPVNLLRYHSTAGAEMQVGKFIDVDNITFSSIGPSLSQTYPEIGDENIISYQMNEEEGTEIADLVQRGTDSGSLGGSNIGVETDGAGTLLFNTNAVAGTRTHALDSTNSSGKIVLDYCVSEWDFNGMAGSQVAKFQVRDSVSTAALSVNFDFSGGNSRIYWSGGTSMQKAFTGITSGSNLVIRTIADLDAGTYKGYYNLDDAGWVVVGTETNGFSSVDEFRLASGTTTAGNTAYIKVDYANVSTIAAVPTVGNVGIDNWDMNGNGLNQISDNGASLGSVFATNNQTVAQVDDDQTFIFAPPTGNNYGPKKDLSSVIDLTNGVVSFTIDYSSMDWSTETVDNNQVGIRLVSLDAGSTNWVSLSFQDWGATPKIWAYAKTSADLGAIAERCGRLVNGLGPDTTARSILLEIDYANGEIRTRPAPGSAWQYDNASGVNDTQWVHTNAVDFAAAGVTSITLIQPYYVDWTAGDETVFDNIRIEQVQPIVEVVDYYGDTVMQEWNFTDGSLLSETGLNATFFNNAGNVDNIFDEDTLTVNRPSGTSGTLALGDTANAANSSDLTLAVTISEFDFSASSNQQFKVKLRNGTTTVEELKFWADPAALGRVKVSSLTGGTAGRVFEIPSSSTPITYGITLDFDNDEYAVWAGSPDVNDGWTWTSSSITGSVALSSVNIDSVQWSIDNAETNGTFTLDRIIISRNTGASGPTVVPNITEISVAGTTVSLTWDSESGISYNVLSKSALTNVIWSTEAPAIPGAGASTSTDVTGSGTEEFYTIEAYTP